MEYTPEGELVDVEFTEVYAEFSLQRYLVS